jgi:hypothetical protein
MWVRRFTIAIVASLFVLAADAGNRSSSAGVTLFDEAVESLWQERRLAVRRSHYSFVERNGERRLVAESNDAASALYHRVSLRAAPELRLSWRWRVEQALELELEHEASERTRDGDDYVARVAVMFDGKPFGRKTRSLMYVWAREERVGAGYPSPYSDNVRTLVLRDDASPVGRWIPESRDVVRDIEALFAMTPETITAIAIMVDTDNTDSRAVTWFDRLRIGD